MTEEGRKRSNANLIPAKKGEVRNPNGRPKGASLKAQVQSLFIEMMNDEVKYRGKATPFLTAYKQEFLTEALNGGWSARFLADRLFSEGVMEQIDKSLNKSLREDADFMSYRILRQAFDVQQQILLSKKRQIFLMAGRRAGKTAVIRLKIADVLATGRFSTDKEHSGTSVLYLAKTFRTGIEQVYNPLLLLMEDLGFDIAEQRRNEGYLRLANGSELFVRSNDNKESRETLRGGHYDLAIIDEAQSQPQLKYLIESIIEPMLIDHKGTLVLAGTGPRSAGTYWEYLWNNHNPDRTLCLNWNLSQNPYIENYEKELEEIRQEKCLKETDSLYQREYLGKPVYDIDALVYRLTDNNFYTDNDLRNWLANHPASDIAFTAGLDFGFQDSDAIVIIMHSRSKKEKFIVWEHKINHVGIKDCADAITAGMNYLNSNPLFSNLKRSVHFFADSGGLGCKIAFELATQYKLPVMDAYKANKDNAIELLQEEIRMGNLKVPKGGIFEQEALKTVFKRDEHDNIVREIDDNEFHPDIGDAVLYALRPIWLTSPQRLGYSVERPQTADTSPSTLIDYTKVAVAGLGSIGK